MARRASAREQVTLISIQPDFLLVSYLCHNCQKWHQFSVRARSGDSAQDVRRPHHLDRLHPPISKGEDAVSLMDALRVMDNRLPVRIQMHNGSEFISKSLDKWVCEHGAMMDSSRLGKPTDNPFIESFNGSLQGECLNIHWFLSLENAQDQLEN